MIFGPKPPPTNGAMTRTCRSLKPEHGGKPVAHEHRRLRRVPDRQLVGARVPLRDHAAGLDRRGRAVLVAEAPLDDAIGLGARGGIVALGSAAHGRRRWSARRRGPAATPALERLFQIDHRRQRLELDVDVVERVLGDVAALGDHDRQRLADMADLVLGERHLGALVEDDAGDRRRRHQQRARAASSRRDRRRYRPRRRPARCRAAETSMLTDAGMRDLAAQERRMQHARQLDVVDEQRLAGAAAGDPRCA